jgi:hypothetical protein
MTDDRKVTVENVNHPDYRGRVNAEKYQAMRTALLAVLPVSPPGLTQSEMTEGVKAHLPDDLFPGGSTAGWWAKTVQLDLEAKNVVVRHGGKPLRWVKRTS